MPDTNQGSGIINWLFGGAKVAETPDQAVARKKKEAAEKTATENIQKAIRGYGILKKVVQDSDSATKSQQKDQKK